MVINSKFALNLTSYLSLKRLKTASILILFWSIAKEKLNAEFCIKLILIPDFERISNMSLRFSSTIEILPGWKMLRVDGRTAGNFGFVWGNSIKIRREEYFDGNFIFKSPVPYNVTGIPLYHLHHLRKNATLRIFNNKFHGGGIEYDIGNCPSIPDTSYVVHLKKNFKNGFPIDSQHPNNYLGSGLNPP